MENFTKIFKQTSWQVLGKVVTSFSTFIILGLIARNYGASGTGIFTLALTYLAIFYLLADFGFNAHVLRRVKESESQRVSSEWQKLLGTRIIWSGVLVIISVGLLPFLPFSSPGFIQAVFFGSLAIVFSSIFTTSNLIFQSKLRYDLSVLAVSFGTLSSLGVFIFLALFKYPIPLLLFAHLLGWVLITVAALFLVRRILRSITPLIDFNYTLKLLKESWPIAATLALNVVYFRADSFIVAYFKSVSDVGVYNLAYSIFQSILVLPTFIMNAYYPLMLKSFGGLKIVILGLIGLSVTGTLVTLVLAPTVVSLIGGEGFSGSVKSLQILSLGFPAFFLSSLLMWMLVARGRYKMVLLLYTSGLIFNIILNLFYIPKYSYFAASYITVISEYLILILQSVVLLRKQK